MATKPARERQFWVKSIGSATRPLEDPWQDPRWDSECAFPSSRSIGVKVGDFMIYYAAHHQHLFGIVEVLTEEFLSTEPFAQEWPRRLRVRPILHRQKQTPLLTRQWSVGPFIRDYFAPSGHSLSQAITQKSHIRISANEFERVQAALETVL
jgi:hypothetical protein